MKKTDPVEIGLPHPKTVAIACLEQSVNSLGEFARYMLYSKEYTSIDHCDCIEAKDRVHEILRRVKQLQPKEDAR